MTIEEVLSRLERVHRYRRQIRLPLLAEALGDTSLADVKKAFRR